MFEYPSPQFSGLMVLQVAPSLFWHSPTASVRHSPPSPLDVWVPPLARAHTSPYCPRTSTSPPCPSPSDRALVARWRPTRADSFGGRSAPAVVGSGRQRPSARYAAWCYNAPPYSGCHWSPVPVLPNQERNRVADSEGVTVLYPREVGKIALFARPAHDLDEPEPFVHPNGVDSTYDARVVEGAIALSSAGVRPAWVSHRAPSPPAVTFVTPAFRYQSLRLRAYM